MVEVSELKLDFIFHMDDDTYKHFEFQTSYSKKNLTRFARYDSLLYDRDGKKIETVIIYSSNVRKIDKSLDIGALKYKPTNIMMYKFNGNAIYKDLEDKLKEKRELTDTDMLNLIFLPLMRNTIPKDELALKSIELAKTIEDERKREACIVSAVVFTNIYLDENEMNRVWEVAKMTDVIGRLMQQEIDKEVAEKVAKEVAEKVAEEKIKNAKSLLDVLDVETISQKFKLTVEEVEVLKEQSENI